MLQLTEMVKGTGKNPNVSWRRNRAGFAALFFCACMAAAFPAFAADNAQFISQSVPSTMYTGSTYTVSITMKNIGTTTWTKATNYKLGSQNPRDNSIWGLGRVLLSDTDSIAPTQSKTFSFKVKAPASAGTYNFQWRMLRENVCWFGSYSTNLSINVLPNQAPTVNTPAPSSGASNSEQTVTFTSTYTDPDGWQNILYGDLLFNTLVSGLNCVQLRYNQDTNKLYLRNDANTAWLGGYAPGSANTIENSYGKLYCASTTVSGSGTTLTIKWSLAFKSAFCGSKYIFPHVQDDRGLATSWVNKGSWRINFPPTVGTITPAQGNALPNQTITFTSTYSDSDGWQNISAAYILLNTGVSGYNCLYARYNPGTNKLYLRNDGHTAWLGGFTSGSSNTIENSYVKLDCSKSTAAGSGTSLSVTWSVTFKDTFTGVKKSYLYVSDSSKAYNGWLQKGDFCIFKEPVAAPAQ